jgi:hypothetical protein
MPRIPDNLLEAVLYLYPSEHEAREGINIGGSGFLVSIPCRKMKGDFIYVVTNRHVIATADFVRLNTRDGGTYIERLPREDWVRSATDDIAIRGIGFPDDRFAQKMISVTSILTEAEAKAIQLGIGDHVFMTGRFINHEGRQQNAPMVRFGVISQMPGEPISYQLDGNRHDQISILADIRSIGGYSGSPVFLNEFPIFGRPPNAKNPGQHWLIGVDWGHIPLWSPVCGQDEEPIGYTQVNINSGMAGIVPSWKLLDLIMSDDLVRARDLEEDRFLSAQKSKGAVADVVTPIAVPPATDANPNHQEDFTRLLGAAARKPPQAS